MKVVLVSCYEMGRQPFGLASPAAWLVAGGHEVVCFDLAVEHWQQTVVAQAGLIAFYLPMHTATRLALRPLAEARQMNARAHLCCYGLYAPLNEQYLRRVGAQT